MKDYYLTILRNKKTSLVHFRMAAEKLVQLLSVDAVDTLSFATSMVETPFEKTTGKVLLRAPLVISILRSGLAMLAPFLQLFPDAPIGFLGMRRDEKTLEPHLYYENLPQIQSHDKIFLLDPMLATGGSATLAIQKLLCYNAKEENIVFVGILASKIGVDHLNKKFPKVKLCIAAIDNDLNQNAFIVPGLGDFGDRFFGTTEDALKTNY